MAFRLFRDQQAMPDLLFGGGGRVGQNSLLWNGVLRDSTKRLSNQPAQLFFLFPPLVPIEKMAFVSPENAGGGLRFKPTRLKAISPGGASQCWRLEVRYRTKRKNSVVNPS
jgi:hypothetical protein